MRNQYRFSCKLGISRFFKDYEIRRKGSIKRAVFEVSNENFKQNVTTNDKGIAELGNLPIGIYSVKEIQAPAGYVLDGMC